MPTTTLLVKQDELSNARIVAREDARLAAGQVRVRVDSFALTANNITYAAFGESMNYWGFFPSGEAGWGIVPVWGFGTVAETKHAEVAVGERMYGYWPMADFAVLQPGRVSEAGFTDAAPHRAELHAIYNQYLRTGSDPFYSAQGEDVQSILRPLFTTSWLIDDFLADNDFFGAKAVLLSSASSKTAYGTAFMLAQREGIEVIGLTSARNVAFTESLGCYSRAVTYEQLESIAADTPLVYVDFAGDAPLRRRIHERFANLAYSCSVGGTHVEALGGSKGLPGPRPVLFFAPAQAKKRQADWGPGELGRKLVASWRAFVAKAADAKAPWLVVERHRGADAVHSAYAQVYGGRGDPRVGHILSLD
ncbi:MAG TPA: DUF2855 family protein [Ramlibacter sp.]|nr:DUF2855 family protein [Ramlibacter sp.]